MSFLSKKSLIKNGKLFVVLLNFIKKFLKF